MFSVGGPVQTGSHLPSSPDSFTGERTKHLRGCKTKPPCDTSSAPPPLSSAAGEAEDGEGQGHRRIPQVANPQGTCQLPPQPVADPKIRYRHPEPTLSSPGETTLCSPHSWLFSGHRTTPLLHRGLRKLAPPPVCRDRQASLLATVLFFFLSFFFCNQVPFWERGKKPGLSETASCLCTYKIHQL